ncbi:MAG TPA: twin-arginine translocase TatA/TatE family subunit [Chloroflexota bacterium]|jgi:sec-independent protein translocase protein TatA|nr:twin-arginine translocase TatA/TatE family subunit [Chloroflexota bacterium]
MFLAGHLPELIIVLVLVVLIFGAKSIPGLAKGIGQGISEIRKATKPEDEPGAEKAKTDAS